jgi:hypothetical protein
VFGVFECLVDGMVENAQLATQADARAARRTIEMLDAGAVKEPWRVFCDVADAKAKNIDKSRLMQEKPSQITQTISDTQFYAIEAELERLTAVENDNPPERRSSRTTASCPLRKSVSAADAGTRTTPVCAVKGARLHSLLKAPRMPAPRRHRA